MMPRNTTELLLGINPGKWVAAFLTAEAEGVLLHIFMCSSYIAGFMICISSPLIRPPQTSHHNYSQLVAVLRHWRLQNVTLLHMAHQSAGPSSCQQATVWEHSQTQRAQTQNQRSQTEAEMVKASITAFQNERRVYFNSTHVKIRINGYICGASSHFKANFFWPLGEAAVKPNRHCASSPWKVDMETVCLFT